jgi:hypothetical protein
MEESHSTEATLGKSIEKRIFRALQLSGPIYILRLERMPTHDNIAAKQFYPHVSWHQMSDGHNARCKQTCLGGVNAF